MDAIPPTFAALTEHTKRAAYQAGHCWGQSCIADPVLPSPAEWGWKRTESGQWQPLWNKLTEASTAIRQLIKCGCRPENGCRGRCKCVKAELECTSMCTCSGDCERESR